MNYLKKWLLLVVVCIFGGASVCYGDIIISPSESFISRYTIFILIVAAAVTVLLISLLCILIGKCIKADALLSNSKKVAENIWYYILVILGIFIIYIGNIVTRIVAVVILVISMYLRIKSKKKKASYMVLAMFILIVCSVETIYMSNEEDSIVFKVDWLVQDTVYRPSLPYGANRNSLP